MNIKQVSVNLIDPVLRVFWGAVYALALLFLFGAKVWCAVGHRAETPPKDQLEALGGISSKIDHAGVKA